MSQAESDPADWRKAEVQPVVDVRSARKWLKFGPGNNSPSPAPNPRTVLENAAQAGDAVARDPQFVSAVVQTCLVLAPLKMLVQGDERRVGTLKRDGFELFIREDGPSAYSVMVKHRGELVFGCAARTVHQSRPGPWCTELLELGRSQAA